jgi:hypothetical protein
MGLTRPRLGQFQTTTTAFDDEIIVLNNSATGTNANDIGIVFERGDTMNTALIWDESADSFALVNTTEQGSTKGNIGISSYSALTLGNLVSNGITYPSSDGTSSQVIQTDGSGNLSFTDVATTLDAVTDNGATTTNAISVGAVTVSGNIVPSANETYSLGTATKRFTELYVASSTVYLGSDALSVVSGDLYINGDPVAGAGDAWPGYDGNYDNSKSLAQTTAETEFEAGGDDAFGVSTALLFDNMTPSGQTVNYDYGSGESHVGA